MINSDYYNITVIALKSECAECITYDIDQLKIGNNYQYSRIILQ